MKNLQIFFLIFFFHFFIMSDIVILKNGNKMEGIVKKSGNSIVITMSYGTVTIPLSQVDKIISSITPLEIYQEKRKNLNSKDIEAVYQLAEWCKENGLIPQYKKELLDILSIAPDHEKARSELGYQKYEGKWITNDEFMELQGYIKFKEKWITREEYNLIVIEDLKKTVEDTQRQYQTLEEKFQSALQRIYALEAELQKTNIKLQEVEKEASKPKYVIYRHYCPRCNTYYKSSSTLPNENR